MERLRKDLLLRTALIAPALTGQQFVSHETGLALLGAPLPYTDDDERALHVSARRPAAKPRRDGVVGHRLQQRPSATGAVRGIPVEHPARLWRQIATMWEIDDIIAAGDFLVLPRRRLATIDELRHEVDSVGDVTGGLLTCALGEIRVGAETAEETRLRLLLIRNGLPEPELNIELRTPTGRFVARLDLAYPRYRVAVEHDGRTHAFDEKQFARDADRWDDIRSLGWRHVRILSHHLRPDDSVAVARVTQALLESGWRPGRG
jgi:very-short-patch-repair endonuclease